MGGRDPVSDPQVMVITGTSKGIGKHLVEYYLGQGFRIVGCSRGPADSQFENYRHYCLDVSDEAAVKGMFSEIGKNYGRLDVLLNNAGAASARYAMLTSRPEAQNVLNTNVIGTFLCCREALVLMKRRAYGRIANISSIHVPLATVGSSIYSASKAAVAQFSRVLAREVAPFGITVNVLGLSMVGDMGMVQALSDQAISETLQHTITKRRLDLDDVTHALDFLISEKSGMITGEVLFLGGA